MHVKPVGLEAKLHAVEWPTCFVAAVIYGLWLCLTWFHAQLPIYILLPAGAIVTAWHGSLQHEIVHGHPTPWPRVNWLMGVLPLNLWLPLVSYRLGHLEHHVTAHLTEPPDDSESKYYSRPQWHHMGPLLRFVAALHATLLGRMIIGPFWTIISFFMGCGPEMRENLRAWAWHFVGVGLVLVWVLLICHMSFLYYVLCFVLAGTSLSLVRSFAEHRAAPEFGHRTAIVESGPFWSLLFLNNNLHVVHHLHPGLAWYRIPQLYRQKRDEYLQTNGNLLYKGYGEIFRRYFLKPHDQLIHPFKEFKKGSEY